MRFNSLFFAFLIVLTGCKKTDPEPVPPGDSALGPRRIEYVLAVKYPLVETYIEDYLIDVPFDEHDQMVVEGDGISGVLSYDRYYVYPGYVGFSGYLEYDGPGDPPKNLPIHVKRINTFLSHDGTPISHPVLIQGEESYYTLGRQIPSLKAAANRYGVYSGSCTFGNPSVELSLATSFIGINLVFATSFPGGRDKKAFLFCEGQTYGPFDFKVTNKMASIVCAVPAGTKLVQPILEIEGLARFPIKLEYYPVSQGSYVMESGFFHEINHYLYDLSSEEADTHTSQLKCVFYQSGTQPTSKSIYIINGSPAVIYLSNINIESTTLSPISFLNDAYIWVDGECRAISKVSRPAIYGGGLTHIQGDGTLYALNVGGEGGAGISIGSYSRRSGDIVIDGDVSVVAQGASGAAGIGTDQVASYQSGLNCGSIRIDTKGTVKATGGEGAAGIGPGRVLYKPEVHIHMGSIVISGGIVDASGGGDGVCDIGVDEDALLTGTVTVGEGVTWDGVHGYQVSMTREGVPIGYSKSTDSQNP